MFNGIFHIPEPKNEPVLTYAPGTRERAELLDGEDEPRRRARLRDLLDRDEQHERPGAGAPVLLVEGQREDVVLAEELDHVVGELRRGVDLRRSRRHPFPRQGAHEVAELALLVCEDVPGHRRAV